MNLKLKYQIASHILSNLGIIPSDFVKFDGSNLLIDKEFKLGDSLKLIEDDQVVSYNLFGCQFSAEDQELKVILCNLSKNEHNIIIQLKNSPFYGILLNNEEALIACSLDGTSWLECSTYLQASLLAGMESVKETGFTYSKCLDYKNQVNALKSFILYQDSYYESL